MTTLVLKFEGNDVALGAWNAEGFAAHTTIHAPEATADILLPIPFDEFLALIAEGGMVVDLRKLQEEK